MDAYPVGAIYVSTVATSPSELFGGTWEALEQGRVLIGQGTDYAAGSTGGEKEHAITVAEMPEHTHTMGNAGSHSHSGATSSTGSHRHNIRGNKNQNYDSETTFSDGHSNLDYYIPSEYAGSHSHTLSIDSAGSHSHTINSAGSGEAVSLMQPYLAVYMWKRVA